MEGNGKGDGGGMKTGRMKGDEKGEGKGDRKGNGRVDEKKGISYFLLNYTRVENLLICSKSLILMSDCE